MIRAPEADVKKRLRAEQTFQPGPVSERCSPKARGMGMAPRWVGAWAQPTGPQSSEVRKSGDRGAEEGNIVATSPSPFKTPRQEGCPGLTSFPPRLLPGRKGLPVPQQQGKGGKEAGRCCNPQSPGLSEAKPLTTGLGREARLQLFSGTCLKRAETREAGQPPWGCRLQHGETEARKVTCPRSRSWDTLSLG